MKGIKQMKKIMSMVKAALPTVPVAAFALLLVATPEVGAQVQDGVNVAQPDDVPTELDGQGGVITTIVNILLYVIGIISVIMLIIGGIRYAISGGDSGQVTSAKNTILYAIIGLVVAIFAYAIVNWVVGTII